MLIFPRFKKKSIQYENFTSTELNAKARPLQPNNSTVNRYAVYKDDVGILVMKEKHGGQCLFNEQCSASFVKIYYKLVKQKQKIKITKNKTHRCTDFQRFIHKCIHDTMVFKLFI